MVFLCFSSNDRYTIAESILYHLKNYGIKVWYDYHTLILGDDKIEENIINGVEKCEYVILILSPNFFNSACGNLELESIKKLYDKKQIHIFPILYNIEAKNLPDRYSWIRDLIYNELNTESNTLPTCNQVVCKILIDRIRRKNYSSFKSLNPSDPYLKFLFKTYNYLDEANITAKITILYVIYGYLSRSCKLLTAYNRIIEQLFKYTALNIYISFKELIIAENAIALMCQDS